LNKQDTGATLLAESSIIKNIIRMAKGKNKASMPDDRHSDTAAISAAMKERAGEVFRTHNVEEIYATSDETLFIQIQNATAQAAFLDDKTITTIKREETV
jgi:hypothetical protein